MKTASRPTGSWFTNEASKVVSHTEFPTVPRGSNLSQFYSFCFSSRYLLIPYAEQAFGLGMARNSQIKGKCTCLRVGRALFESLAPLPTMGMALSKSTNFSELQLKGKFDRDDQRIS